MSNRGFDDKGNHLYYTDNKRFKTSLGITQGKETSKPVDTSIKDQVNIEPVGPYKYHLAYRLFMCIGITTIIYLLIEIAK